MHRKPHENSSKFHFCFPTFFFANTNEGIETDHLCYAHLLSWYNMSSQYLLVLIILSKHICSSISYRLILRQHNVYCNQLIHT